MPNLSRSRVIRAVILASLAAVALSRSSFVSVDRLRAKVVAQPVAVTGGVARVSTVGFAQVNALRPPFALIARISTSAASATPITIAVDGNTVCEPSVSPGASRRVDCAVTGAWNPSIDHAVTVQGPSTPWTLESLELATHHGSSSGVHYLMILPAASEHFVRPGIGWLIATWLVVCAALLLLPASPSMPRWARAVYVVVAGAIVFELVVINLSVLVSNYRLLISAGTFARLLGVLFIPRLWSTARTLARLSESYPPLRHGVLRSAWVLLLLLIFSVTARATWNLYLKEPWHEYQARRREEQARRHIEQMRSRLFAELQPVKLANCSFERFGEKNDGGYLLCANLLGNAKSAYSYGISGYDGWGCDVSKRLAVPVHEYDCFNLDQPRCPAGQPVFHGECVAGATSTMEGRFFDTPENQFLKNGDAGKQVVMKMDVEGAEWETFEKASDAVLQRIDQLTIELHGIEEPERFLSVVSRLKQFFYVASLHFNNFACADGPALAPFPALVYEVLFVSKRLAVPGGPGPAGPPPELLTENNPTASDCQTLADLPQTQRPHPTGE